MNCQYLFHLLSIGNISLLWSLGLLARVMSKIAWDGAKQITSLFEILLVCCRWHWNNTTYYGDKLYVFFWLHHFIRSTISTHFNDAWIHIRNIYKYCLWQSFSDDAIKIYNCSFNMDWHKMTYIKSCILVYLI